MTTKTPNRVKHDVSADLAMLSVKWWEKKRLLFNLILTLFIAIMLFLKSGLPNTWLEDWWLTSSVIWVFGANLVYCGSWGSELLWSHYIKTEPFWLAWRLLIYVLGTLFSISWTWKVLIPFV